LFEDILAERWVAVEQTRFAWHGSFLDKGRSLDPRRPSVDLLAHNQRGIAAHCGCHANLSGLERGIAVTANEKQIVALQRLCGHVNVQWFGNQVAIGIADKDRILCAANWCCGALNVEPLAHQVTVAKLVGFTDQDTIIVAVQRKIRGNADALLNQDSSCAVWGEFLAAHEQLVILTVYRFSLSQRKSLSL
jgi:hypothetical protein